MRAMQQCTRQSEQGVQGDLLSDAHPLMGSLMREYYQYESSFKLLCRACSLKAHQITSCTPHYLLADID